MKNRKAPLIATGVALMAFLALAAVAFLTARSGPAVSLEVVGRSPKCVLVHPANAGFETHRVLLLAVTNHTRHTFTYVSGPGENSAHCRVLQSSDPDWDEPWITTTISSGVSQRQLGPKQAVTFSAHIPTNQPVKIVFEYSDGRKRGNLASRLPWWLAHKLPWVWPTRTATTGIIEWKEPTSETLHTE